jgi:histidinol-phosphate aminotransferase
MELIHADRDELNFPPSSKVVKTLNSLNKLEINRYLKNSPLIEELSKFYNLSPERIFIEEGIIGIIHRVFDNMLNSQSRVLIPEFGYSYYKKLAEHHKAKITSFNSINLKSNFYYDLKDLLEKIKEKPDILVLIDPENPLCFSTTEEDLYKILESTSSETLVILDQAHEGFRENHIKDIKKLTEKFPNLLIARGFSKFYGLAGLRIAYALCGENIKELIKFKEKYLGSDVLAQTLAIAALNSQEHYIRNAKNILKEKNRFNRALKSLKNYNVYDSDTMSCIIEVPENQVETLKKQAVNSNISIRNLYDYNPKLKNFFKITMCPSKHIDRIIDLFESVHWLYELEVPNSKSSVINTRDEGYTVNRFETHSEKFGVLTGIHRVIIPPAHLVSEHRHLKQEEIFEFFSDAFFKLNGKEMKVKAGKVIKLRKGDLHEIRASDNKFVRFAPIRFPYIHEDKYSPKGKQIVHEKT